MTSDPPKLTVAHQALAACMTVVVAEVIESDRRAQVLRMMAEIVDQAHEATPMAEALVAAARGLMAVFPVRRTDPTGTWARALLAAQAVVADYNWARACVAHDMIFPQPPYPFPEAAIA